MTLLAFAVGAVLSGCTGTVVDPAPSSKASVATVEVSLASASVTTGQATQATAVVRDASRHVLSGHTIAWSTDNGGVATVTATGAVLGAGAGTANIIATSDGKSGSAVVTVTRPSSPPSGRWVTGYYVGYQRDLYPETTIDFSSLTHITVGRIRPTLTGGLTTDFDIDPVTGPAMAKTIATEAHQAGRKALLMLGGAGEHDAFVGATSSANRAAFEQKLLSTLTDLGYDGLDVDWEPVAPADQAPLLALLTELRAARPGIILTIPVAWVNMNFPTVDAWYANVAKVVDQMNMMTYDMAGGWDGWQSWYSSALDDAQPAHPSSIASSAAAYKASGVPASKIGIGVPFYGACWRNVTAPRQTLVTGADVYASDNEMSYANIMGLYYVAAARSWDATAQVPYLSFATPKGPNACTFISYDDAQSVAAKGTFVKSNGYGGAITWTLGEGHLINAPAGQQDPLLKALYTAVAP
ncbi:MAG: chitinase [Gemmatimonadaceae bacterium]|nr:chitinase [Gemmatimonadaceae bacterium]